MKKYFLIPIAAALFSTAIFFPAHAAAGRKSRGDIRNALKSMYTPDYLILKQWIVAEFRDAKPGKFGEFIQGVKKDPKDGAKVLALTFDACGGKYSGYNAKLIEYLRQEKLPATLFVTGLWIDRNPETFRDLAKDPLFEIANHGLMHRTCSIDGRTAYRIRATRDIGDVVDEMELNARKIAAISGRRPAFFRSATAYTDEASVRIARRLGMEVISYDILSGDAMRSSAKTMARNIVKGARHGAVVIMHFNHPEWHEMEALQAAVPALRLNGYTFARLTDLKPAELYISTASVAGPGISTAPAAVPGAGAVALARPGARSAAARRRARRASSAALRARAATPAGPVASTAAIVANTGISTAPVAVPGVSAAPASGKK